ncbi:ribonuclease H family protein [Agrobacterium tumefaciens]|uniref:ribonuclease H family protein n=1 Tax=Agrobacterium tumefaciens TaxID=358 RepID=UPI001FA96817|nr:ribonuclease H [Agrobacterium tumefaciens]UNZ51898.1 ribonuclease HI [Agrobacterium tumefaciens]
MVKPGTGKHRKDFSPSRFAAGIHIFSDGAAIPNPGAGGWGVVIYEDGAEIATGRGGDPETTNNQMELVGLLNAIEKAKALAGNPAVTIWSDSQYCVKGCNEWMPGWKAKGWFRADENAEPKNRVVMNVELWKAIDEALSSAAGNISIRWVKGHCGVAGNERADQLAEQGRQEAIDRSLDNSILGRTVRERRSIFEYDV